MLLLQEAVGVESAAKRTRLSVKSSPSKESALEAKQKLQSDALDHDVKQVMDYADEKVQHVLLSMQQASPFCKSLQVSKLLTINQLKSLVVLLLISLLDAIELTAVHAEVSVSSMTERQDSSYLRRT